MHSLITISTRQSYTTRKSTEAAHNSQYFIVLDPPPPSHYKGRFKKNRPILKNLSYSSMNLI